MKVSSVIASTYRVYDENLLGNPDFMSGWRLWSFYKTRVGESMEVTSADKTLICQMIKKGNEINKLECLEWNRFRSNLLSLFPTCNKTLHYRDQYRHIFKRVAFVVVDCCFAIKYKMDSKGLTEILMDMFEATDAHDLPTHFIILDNHITDSEFNHKLNQFAREEYRGTQDKILDYRAYNPNLKTDRIVKLPLPFGVAHKALSTSEKKVRDKMSQKKISRAGINDFALIFMIDKIRRSFGMCARVALLSDDFGLLHYASTFNDGYAKSGANLPREYVEHHIVTPRVLEPRKWNQWRRDYVHPYFANHISDM